MIHDEIKQAVLEYIRKNKAVSYAEIERVFEANGFDYNGDLEIYSPKNNNIVFWADWNEEAVAIINELKVADLIHQEPAGPLTYLLDGKGLAYPAVKSGGSYKTPHWLPLVFRPGPWKKRCS